MKRYLIILALAALVMVGCSNESNILSPVESNTELGSTEPNWIFSGDAASLRKDASVSKTVYGNQETLLEINTNYAGGQGWISITATARFQRNSFTGSRYITMTVNDQFGTATFTPSGTFSKPVIYTLNIVGLNLQGKDPSKIKFVYMSPDGKYYTPAYDQLVVNIQEGRLHILNAKLPHFSKYGFIE